MSTKFLMIYCPSKVGTNSEWLKVSCGKKSRGKKVPAIYRYNRINVNLSQALEIRPSPMMHSQTASIGIEKPGLTSPKVSISMVRPAISSAELNPGKNFIMPNQIKMIPRPILKMFIPFLAFHATILISVNLLIPNIIIIALSQRDTRRKR